MSKEQNYMDKGGNECPQCGSSDITGGVFEADSKYAWRDVACNECDEEWRENFTMTGVDL
jgi:formate dehydrogenase maturation protein FdhE